MRCRENFQGDRCKKDHGHHFATHPERDATHQGAFTAWEGEGDSKKETAKAKGAVRCISKANLKKAGKLVAMARQHNDKSSLAILDFVLRGLRRGQ